MRLDRRLLRNLDTVLIAVTLALIAFGFIAVYSATRSVGTDTGALYYLKRQIMWAVLGCGAVAVMTAVDYRVFQKWARPLYAATLAMLAIVVVLAPTIAGAERWLVIGPVQVQPSEFAKIAIIITLAAHLVTVQNWERPTALIAPLAHALLPMGLIVLQSDLGTALVVGAIALGMLYFAGAKTRHLLVVLAVALIIGIGAVLLSTNGMVPLLKDYQVKRLTVFVNPYDDPQGAGYNVIQSMIAVGSGGFAGKGLFGGSQTHLNFLPARHTDFIFSVIGEEFGFLGALALLGLFGLFLARIVRATIIAKDPFGSLLAGGVASMFFFHIMVNIGMTLGVMPITGITLPFISQGGSSLFSNLLAVGLVLNVIMRRRKILF